MVLCADGWENRGISGLLLSLNMKTDDSYQGAEDIRNVCLAVWISFIHHLTSKQISRYLINGSTMLGRVTEGWTTLYGDTLSTIVAGRWSTTNPHPTQPWGWILYKHSDTAATTLVAIFYPLVRHREQMRKLQRNWTMRVIWMTSPCS